MTVVSALEGDNGSAWAIKENRHCPDLNWGSPVYETGALTAKPQRRGNQLEITYIR